MEINAHQEWLIMVSYRQCARLGSETKILLEPIVE